MLKRLLLVLGWGGICLSVFCSHMASAGEQVRRPNILLILADDLGVNDIGSWGDGVAQTPELDHLSRQSVRFRRFYTDSTCSVSRASLLTGRAPVSIGFEPDGYGISPDVPTLPRSLHALGYKTHHIGKWHVGEAIENPAVWPLQQGYDDWFGMFNHFLLQGPDATGKMLRQRPTYFNPWLQENNLPARQYQGHLDDLLTERAVSLIDSAKLGEPWFINLWYLAPHHPVEPSAEFAKLFPNTPEGQYLALLNQLDHNVGRVLAALEKTGQADNTIVVFASDNGSPNLTRDSNAPLKGKKATYLEGGVRTPLFIRWPGHAAGDNPSITELVDLYPTLMRMVGERAPENLDGVSLANAIKQQSILPDRNLFWAADIKDWGMAFGGHLPGKGTFYRDFFARYSTPEMTGPLDTLPEQGPWKSSFSESQVSDLIAGWERVHRPIPLVWDERRKMLSGRDFQRAPLHGSFSIGFGLLPDKSNESMQTLIDQQGLWSLILDASDRVRMAYGGKVLQGPVLKLQSSCNSLVASFSLKPDGVYPFPGKASSVFTLYLNGEQVMTSDELLLRPTEFAALHNPTYIGRSATGVMPFQGKVTRPIVVGKFLKPEQPGYGLKDMQAAICR